MWAQADNALVLKGRFNAGLEGVLAASRATRHKLIFRGDRWRGGLDQSGRDDRDRSAVQMK